MYDSQYGFRKEHSMEFAALELIDRILTRMDNKEIPIFTWACQKHLTL